MMPLGLCTASSFCLACFLLLAAWTDPLHYLRFPALLYLSALSPLHTDTSLAPAQAPSSSGPSLRPPVSLFQSGAHVSLHPQVTL